MANLKNGLSLTLIIGALVSSILLSAFLLRQNNLRMIELRNEVIKVDEETGDLDKIEPALNELRGYILTHMNTEMPQPLELPGAYSEAVEAARKKAEQSGQANSEVYRRAQQVCEDPNKALSIRAQCIQDYVRANARPGTNPQDIKFPAKELYSYDFASPVWSSDLAGWSVVASVLLAVTFVYKLFTDFILVKIKNMIDNDPLE